MPWLTSRCRVEGNVRLMLAINVRPNPWVGSEYSGIACGDDSPPRQPIIAHIVASGCQVAQRLPQGQLVVAKPKLTHLRAPASHERSTAVAAAHEHGEIVREQVLDARRQVAARQAALEVDSKVKVLAVDRME